MILNEAKNIATKYLRMFDPHCEEIQIAGSIRREKPEVKDIELVCIPKRIEEMSDLFGSVIVNSEGFIKLVNSFNRTKGNGEGKYTQLILDEGIKLDLFIADEINFGLLFMLRTGSAEFSKRMVTEIKQNGYRSDHGYLIRYYNNEVVPVRTEAEFFRVTGMKFVNPVERIL